ncbi:MAG: ABC-F type ribosomal protection protein [Niameybacter sp.]|uniref:ribosomal protection-like ABC-F family protein n=1 Tax=Niameybacter sp. TaxID=2033640 RepID=UPI002FC61B2C
MSIINVNQLTFSYDSHHENIFENTSFTIDTDWKLGFIGRNGRGKTTFLNLLLGKYEYKGSIISSVTFDYFPFQLEGESITLDVIRNVIAPYSEWENEMKHCIEVGTEESLERYGALLDLYLQYDGYIINDLIEKEIGKLNVAQDVLVRPFTTLSNGERTKIMLAALFLKKNNFLLIDEPTNHLDIEGRQVVADYLKTKNGFILVSHDRIFLGQIIDHVLSINRNNIEVVKGNYETWKFNRDRQDQYELGENEKLQKEIGRLETASRKTKGWSTEIEKSKMGSHAGDRGYIGHKSAKMMKRAKVIEKRQDRLIDEKQHLLKNVEQVDSLKLHAVDYVKNVLIDIRDLSIQYGEKQVCQNVSFRVEKGQRVALRGSNGCGKSSIIKLLMGIEMSYTGKVIKGSELKVSYVPQDTSFLKGDMKTFVRDQGIDESLFKATLRKLDFTRNAFDKDLSELSGGQKKKVLIAKSLSEEAHIYIWDEPLNFIDILSRNQIEELILKYEPTMIFVEHDRLFNERIATEVIEL